MNVFNPLVFTSTNESLNAVVNGLEISETDRVLAVGGSGDQAFAMLERARSVEVWDISQVQLNYIQRRLEALREGHFERFLGETEQIIADNDSHLVRNYFSRGGRFERIRERVDRLKLVTNPMDILNDLSPKNFLGNKVYFSNAIGYKHKDQDQDNLGVLEIMDKIARGFTKGTVFYSSSIPVPASMIGSSAMQYLLCDVEKSELARRYEEEDRRQFSDKHYLWNPGVFVRK